MKNILIIGLGGFIGSVLRFFISKLNHYIDFFSLPLGTLSVNIVGSFLIGIFAGISLKSNILSLELQLFLITGLMGGFTTFSSFTHENLTLLQNGQIISVIIYTGTSIILGFLAVYLGYYLCK